MTEIQHLGIEVPNLSEEAGRQLGQQVAEKVAALMPNQAVSRHIPSLSVALELAPNTSISSMSDAIAAQIIKEITLL